MPRQPQFDGALHLAVGIDPDRAIVRVIFETPTSSFGLSPDDARDLAALLIEKADELDPPSEPPHDRRHH